MRRRDVLAALAGAAAWPRVASARDNPARIGFLAGGAATSINSAYHVRTIKQGLADSGLVEGRDYVFEARFAAGDYQRFSELARDLIAAGPRLILANTPGAVRAVRQLAPSLPIVIIDVDDPAHDGPTTGIAAAGDEFLPKMIDLQRAVLPKGDSMGVLFNPANPPDRGFPGSLKTRAQAAGLSITPIGFQSRNELEDAFATLARQPPAAVHIVLDAGTSDFIDRIPALALLHRLPAFANAPEFATFAGLIGYGTPREPLYLRAGVFAKNILDGAKAGDLPVEQPPRSELWVNRTTARMLELSLPATLLASADRIIG